ncbi:MAG TPA: nucleotidyltransferase family protein [Candidatus Tumulicola sp.]|nr:nucleotidyltransferase family protein [Candidatus Tumulicola sp.]
MALALIPRVGCVVLAAGASTRFDGKHSKLLANVRGIPLAQHAIDAACASRALTCTLVLGAHSGVVREGLETRRCAVVENRRWSDGIASSIRCGLRLHAADEACVILVADQPFVSPRDVDALIAAHIARPSAIVALRAGRVWGTPALFVHRDFAKLRALRGDRGAKAYIKTQSARLVLVEALDARAFTDIDRKSDLAAITRM